MTAVRAADVQDIIGVLFKYVAPPDDEPGAPSPFRFSESGTLGQATMFKSVNVPIDVIVASGRKPG